MTKPGTPLLPNTIAGLMLNYIAQMNRNWADWLVPRSESLSYSKRFRFWHSCAYARNLMPEQLVMFGKISSTAGKFLRIMELFGSRSCASQVLGACVYSYNHLVTIGIVFPHTGAAPVSQAQTRTSPRFCLSLMYTMIVGRGRGHSASALHFNTNFLTLQQEAAKQEPNEQSRRVETMPSTHPAKWHPNNLSKCSSRVPFLLLQKIIVTWFHVRQFASPSPNP